MSRELSASNLAAVTADTITPVLFAELDFGGGVVRAHSAIGTISWGGNDWLGVGTFGQVSAVEDSAEMQRQTVSYTLNGIPSEMLALVLGEQYQGRSAKLYLGFYASVALPASDMLREDTGYILMEDGGRIELEPEPIISQGLVDDPLLIALGKMDVSTIDQGQTLTVIITAESRFAAWNRPIVRRYTNAEQTTRFPGDKGLEFIDQAAQKEIFWGRKTQ